jgi:uncharacterized phage protein gp47/JayE
MAYTRPTISEIVNRIESDLESRLTGDAPLLRRGILRVLVRVFAGAVHIVYGYLEYLSRQLFAATAELEYLNRIGLMFGVTRKAAAFAEGAITFQGVNGTIVPAGTRVVTADGVEYETSTDGTIVGGFVNVNSTAVEPGTAGNMPTIEPIELVEPLAGVSLVIVGTLFAGGQDEETDAAYRQRILERIQTPPAGGTAADYVRWAKEVSGVSSAWTFAATPGPGQVTVVYKGTASASAVEDYIEERMPVTADLSVLETVDQDVDFSILITPDTTANRAAITANLEQLFAEVAAPGEDMLISRVRNAISTAGVDNYDITAITVDGGARPTDSDILFSGYEYGVLGTISYGEL